MTTEPTDAPAQIPTDVPARIPARAAPYGIAPVAAEVPARSRRSRRRRLVDAAVVTSTLAALPVAAAWTRVDDTGGRAEPTTLVGALDALDAADDEVSVRAAAAALAARAPARAATVEAARAPAAAAGPGVVLPGPVPVVEEARAARETPATREEPAARETPAATPLEAAATAATATEPTPIARAAGVELVAPSAAAVLVGFHEAAGPGTVPMKSLAPLAVELNEGKETVVAEEAEDDQVAPVMELPTRDRGQPAASAVDIAVPAWEDIVAPVGGRVTAVSPYTLYGEFADTRIEIEPKGHPGVRVVMIHVGGVEVEPGDVVVAGETVVARTARQFPFSSQIDRFAEEASGAARPHVHMEVIQVA